MTLEQIKLPSYTKGEELFNSISHGIGILFGIFSMIFLVGNSQTSNDISGSIIFSVSAIFLYLSSTIYHAVTKINIKKIFRLIDHSVIYVLITGTIIAFNMIVFSPHNPTIAIITSSVCALVSAIGIALTFIDQEKYKKIQMALYFIIGWSGLFLIYPFYRYCENFLPVLLFVLLGGILYTTGMVFYAKGKKKRYFHSIFHLFVLTGTILHFTAIYFTVR